MTSEADTQDAVDAVCLEVEMATATIVLIEHDADRLACALAASHKRHEPEAMIAMLVVREARFVQMLAEALSLDPADVLRGDMRAACGAAAAEGFTRVHRAITPERKSA
jgi:hypothetical protein